MVLAWLLALSAMLGDGPTASSLPLWPLDTAQLCAASHGGGAARPGDGACQAHDCCTLCPLYFAVLPPPNALPWRTPPIAITLADVPFTLPDTVGTRVRWPRAPPVGLTRGDIGA